MTSLDVDDLHDQSGGETQKPRRDIISPRELSAPFSPSRAEASGSVHLSSSVASRAQVEDVSRAPAADASISTRLATQADNEAVNAFLMTVDDRSYNLRFGELERSELHDFLEINDSIANFIAVKEGKVVGITDCITDARYDPKTVCGVNIIVDGEWQGKGVGKALVTERDVWLKENGYRHKIGLLYLSNAAHIERLRGLGWNEIPADPDEEVFEDDLLEFWTALDPRFKDEEPKLA